MAFFLKSVKLNSLIPTDFKLRWIRDTNTVQEALSLLHKFHISAIPISDEGGNVKKSLDLLDLVAYLVTLTPKPQCEGFPPEEFSEEILQNYLSRQVKTLGDISLRNLLTCVPANKKLRRSIRYLSRKDIHRIYLKEEEILLGVLTQSMIVKFLHEYRSKFADIMNKKVRELWPERTETVVIHQSKPVIDAFKVISKAKVSGVAVVNDSGELVGNISASDLKFTSFYDTARMFNELNGCVQDFMSSRMTENLLPIVVTGEDSLGTVIQKCVENQVHRTYVVDNQMRPIHVVSLSDILSQFII